MFWLAFSAENLAHVHSDDDQLFRELLFELLQLRQDMHAVDAAIGPEIENHELATQVTQAERLGGV